MSDDKKQGKKGLMIAGVVAAAAAGVAYLYGKGGEERREKVKRWMQEAKHDILDRLEKMEEVGKREYEEVVDTVVKEYQEARDITEEEVDDFTRSLKRRWDIIADQAEGGIDDAKEKASTLRKRLKEEFEDMGK